ncbi:MAG: ABC transporter ATP-binding protein [Victivallales bacterium]|jgi:lipoprotein-releasing system ATP-binding protein|nr:ABC transporter ATP-binding protein [Victivallales bacterium]MBT7303501.1 ABC transporter ATP-binding protein [Victivallales bacterium]
MTAPPPLLELSHVTRSFPLPSGAIIEVLRGVDLSLRAGESAAVVGPSGSGKSTLLNIAGTLDQPTAGEVRFAGDSLADLADAELAQFRNREVGFIFQLHHLLPQCTALENVLVPTLAPQAPGQEDARERAQALLERVGLGDRQDSFPAMLSGGERQRVAVVRALINRPRLLLADEPTGALDTAAARDLGDLLVDLNQETGTTLLVVTHSRELADRMGHALILRDGALSPTDS